MLNSYGLNITEIEPGKLALTSFQFCHCVRKPHGLSFFVVWLPRKHHCVQTMRLDSRVDPWYFPLSESASREMDSIGDSTNLRHIELEGNVNIQEACRAMGTPAVPFESVHLRDITFDYEPVSSELPTLVHTAASRLKRLTVDDYFMGDHGGMLDLLLRCPVLTDLTLKLPLIKALPLLVVDMLNHLTELRKLCLDLPEQQWCCSYVGLKKAFDSASCLEDLHVVVRTQEFSEALCLAVEQTSLKAFHLENFGEHDFSVENQIAYLLSSHSTRLETLRVSNFEFYETKEISGALVRNVVLRCFDITGSKIHAEAFTGLFAALDHNVSLKKLKTGKLPYVPDRDAFLCSLIAHYDRLEVSFWTDELIEVLGDSLSSPASCPEQLVVDASYRLSNESLGLLEKGLRSTRSVRTLTLVVSHGIGPSIGDVLRPILARALSITTLKLQLNKVLISHGSFGVDSADAIHFSSPQGKCSCDDWPSYRLGRIGTIAQDKIGSEFHCCCQGIYSVALCLMHNFTITSFEIEGFRVDFPGFVVSRSIARNLTMLNDAVRFVTGDSLEKRCAWSFEMLAGAPSLEDQLRRVSGKSEKDCAAAVVSAFAVLREMYFTITGVVRRSLKCRPSRGTQLDALDAACMHGVSRYLRVWDVVDE